MEVGGAQRRGDRSAKVEGRGRQMPREGHEGRRVDRQLGSVTREGGEDVGDHHGIRLLGLEGR